MSFDTVPDGPPPEIAPGEVAFGASPVEVGGRHGVRLMLKGFLVTIDEHGAPVAFVEVSVPNAVQSVQAIRQAIVEARGRVR